jgi:predicted nucleic acid-binding protein
MDAVYLTSDIIIHYFLMPPEPESHDELDEASQQLYQAAKERSERAAAIIDKVNKGELAVYISDLVLFEIVKAFEVVPFENPEEEPDPEDPLAPRRGTVGFASRKNPHIGLALRSLVVQPNILGIDKTLWDRIFVLYAYDDAVLSIDTAYHTAKAQRIEWSEGREVDGIVSFDEAYDHIKDITRIDPASFQ